MPNLNNELFISKQLMMAFDTGVVEVLTDISNNKLVLVIRNAADGIPRTIAHFKDMKNA